MLKRFGLGFAVGYVVGARSGRNRYEQLIGAGQQLLEVPWVKDLVAAGRDRASEARERIVGAVRDAGGGSSRNETTATTEADTSEDDTESDQTSTDKTERRHDGHATRDARRAPPRAEPKGPRGTSERSGRGSKGAGIARAASAVLERGRTD